MALNLSTLLPAKINTSEIATKYDVSSSVGAFATSLYTPNTTTIDGGKITTGTITAGHISTAGLDAGIIKAGIMYNTGGNASNYTMKIDLNAGSIHIK
jgi:hypothetical protein